MWNIGLLETATPYFIAQFRFYLVYLLLTEEEQKLNGIQIIELTLVNLYFSMCMFVLCPVCVQVMGATLFWASLSSIAYVPLSCTARPTTARIRYYFSPSLPSHPP